MEQEITFRYIRVSELRKFIESEAYDKLDFVPISQIRAHSHARNPRASGDDVSLILACSGSRIVAYLGTLPDLVAKNGKIQKICWFSCLYVEPEFRRSGLAMHLAGEAFRCYQGYVCISNYHPPSKAAFLKTGRYTEVKILKGVRAYRRFDLGNILPIRYPRLKKFKPLISFSDRLLNILTYMLPAQKYESTGDICFSEIQEIPDELSDLVASYTNVSPFGRNAEELNWIMQYPWISRLKENSPESDRYYFSLYGPDFQQWSFLLSDARGKVLGYLLLNRFRNILKTPYLFIPEGSETEVYKFILDLMLREKIPTLVTFHEGLSKVIMLHKRHFLHTRPAVFGFMASEAVMDFLDGDFVRPFEGDGDGAFT